MKLQRLKQQAKKRKTDFRGFIKTFKDKTIKFESTPEIGLLPEFGSIFFEVFAKISRKGQ